MHPPRDLGQRKVWLHCDRHGKIISTAETGPGDDHDASKLGPVTTSDSAARVCRRRSKWSDRLSP